MNFSEKVKIFLKNFINIFEQKILSVGKFSVKIVWIIYGNPVIQPHVYEPNSAITLAETAKVLYNIVHYNIVH